MSYANAKDDLRVSKSWANFHFWVNYPFNVESGGFVGSRCYIWMKLEMQLLRGFDILASSNFFFFNVSIPL